MTAGQNIQDVARCQCQCRVVHFRQQGAPREVQVYHTEVDCDNASGQAILTPFTRRFPVIDAECNPAPPVTIAAERLVVDVDGLAYGLFAYKISSEVDGEQTIEVESSQYLRLDLESLGPPVTVTALYQTGWVPGEPPPQCSDDLVAPRKIEVTLPASIDLGQFDSAQDYPHGCDVSLNQRVRRTSDVFHHLGPADHKAILTCSENTKTGNSYFSDRFVYRYGPRGRECLKAFLDLEWLPYYDRGDLGGIFGPVGGPNVAVLVARALVFVTILDAGFIPAAGADPTRQASQLVFRKTRKLYGPIAVDDVRAQFLSLPEHQPPNCDGDFNNRFNCWGMPHPGTRYPSGGSTLSKLGIAEDWTNFTSFFIRHLMSQDIYDVRGNPGFFGLNCGTLSSSDPALLEIIAPELINPSLAIPMAGNTSFPVAIAAAGDAGENDPEDCQCIDLPAAPGSGLSSYNGRSTNIYLSAGASADAYACELLCEEYGYYTGQLLPVECFPKTIDLRLPGTISFADFRGSCSDGSTYYPFSVDLGASAITDRHADLAAPFYTLAGACDRLTSFFPGWCLLDIFSAGDKYALSMSYLTQSPTQAGNVLLAAGWFPAKPTGGSTNLMRFFTCCIITLRLFNAAGTSAESQNMVAFNLGPEVDRDAYTGAQWDECFQAVNPFGWLHDWNFRDFYFSPCLGQFGPNYAGDGCNYGPIPAPPDYWYCPISIDRNLWAASVIRKDSGVSLPEEFCGICDPSFYGNYCYAHRTNWSCRVDVVPAGSRFPTQLTAAEQAAWMKYLARD